MPRVGKKQFPYTKAGMKAAEDFKAKKAMKSKKGKKGRK